MLTLAGHHFYGASFSCQPLPSSLAAANFLPTFLPSYLPTFHLSRYSGLYTGRYRSTSVPLPTWELTAI